MNLIKHLIAAGVTIFALVAVSAASAQSTSLEGAYVVSGEPDKIIQAAIEKAVADMNFIKRPIARSRLKKTNTIEARVKLSKTASEFSVRFGDRVAIGLPANGSPVKWKREDGEVFDVSGVWKGNQLVQIYKAEDGERINTYTLHPDGATLTMHVELRSPQLTVPVTYDLAYVRAGEGK